MKHITRSCDEYNNIPPGPYTRGHGGVSISWRAELDPFVKTLQEGNERILPVLIHPERKDQALCVICCYLPSGSSREAINLYAEDLAVISELIQKYGTTHNLIIAGDLNADIMNRCNKKEDMLNNLIMRHNLVNLNHNCGHQHTYSYPAMGHASHLDYFLTAGKIAWAETTILDSNSTNSHLNTSTHIPVSTKATVALGSRPPTRGAVRQDLCPRIRWDKIDTEQYQEALIDKLSKYNFKEMKAGKALQSFNRTLRETAKQVSSPRRKRSKTRPLKNKNKLWSKEVAAAVKTAKHLFWRWKTSGRPPLPHPLARAKKDATRAVRRTQRSEAANRRHELMTEIMQAGSNDKTFHKLIRRNRGSSDSDLILRDGETLVSDHTMQLDMWAKYFENLSEQQDYPEAPDEEGKLSSVRDCNAAIKEAYKPPSFTTTEVEQTVKQLNRNKALDKDGISAEHLLYAPIEALQELTVIINKIFKETEAPTECKSGYKIPVPKKGKDTQLQANYRGITVTALVGKVIETLLQTEAEAKLLPKSSKLQFGFTRGLSPSMATLCLNETIAEAKKDKQPLYVTTLDAQKAFDVVNHSKLKQKLFLDGIRGHSWALIDNLYHDIQEHVSWKGQYSRPFKVTKGVRQGAVMSTTLYKLYVNDLLKTLESSGVGTYLGTTYIGSPTCADDILLIARSSSEAQTMIKTCDRYANSHQYTIHPSKSTVTPMLNILPKESQSWYLDDKEMSTTSSFTHLGLQWKQNNTSPCIEGRIALARRTVYALLGTGLHGENGLSPATSRHIIKTYVTPRLLYGLDAVTLSKKQIDDLNSYHRNLIRRIQGLPLNTATEAIYLLLGDLPVEAELDTRALTLYGAVCRAENNETLRSLLTRQSALDNKNSWFQHIIALSQKYQIDINSQRIVPWRKNTWKEYINNTIKSYWLHLLLDGMAKKTSTKWIDNRLLQDLRGHPIWKACQLNSRYVPGAMIRAKLLTSTYMTQERKAKFNKHLVDTLCPLCKTETENIPHFLLRCPATDHIRRSCLEHFRLKGFSMGCDSNATVELLLNGPNQDEDPKFQVIMNQLCHRLHLTRLNLLNDNNNSYEMPNDDSP